MRKVGLQKFRPKEKKKKSNTKLWPGLDAVPPEKLWKETAIHCWHKNLK